VRAGCTYVDGEQHRTVHRPNQGAFDGGSGDGTSMGSWDDEVEVEVEESRPGDGAVGREVATVFVNAK